jgi:hypothetical protein
MDREVTKSFKCFLDWYMGTRREVHTERTLAALERSAEELLLSLKVFRPVSGPLTEV